MKIRNTLIFFYSFNDFDLSSHVAEDVAKKDEKIKLLHQFFYSLCIGLKKDNIDGYLYLYKYNLDI